MTAISFNKQAATNGLRYHRRGQGSVVLFVHGVGLCAESWYPQVDALAPDFDVIVPDLPEHGQSAALNSDFASATLNDYVQSMSDFIDSVTDQAVILCGHSLGALIGIELAAQRPEKVCGLLALNSVYQRDLQALAAVQDRANALASSAQITGVKHTLQRWFGESVSESNQAAAQQCETWLRNNTLEGYAKAYKVFASQSGIRPSALGELNCPITFMTGSKDPNSTPAMSKALADRMRDLHPSKSHSIRAAVVNGAGHMLPLTHAETVIDAIHNINKLINEPRQTTTQSL